MQVNYSVILFAYSLSVCFSYLIALSLEQEQKAEWERAAESADAQTVLPSTPTGTSTASGVTTVIPVNPPVTIFESSKGTPLSDEEIARQLQAEEQAAYKRTQEARERSRQAGQMVAQAQAGAMSANRRPAQQQPQQVSHNARYGRNVTSSTTPRSANTGAMNHHGEQHHRSGAHHQGGTNRDTATHHGSRHGSQSNEGATHHPASGEHPRTERSASGSRPVPEDDADSRRDSRSKNVSCRVLDYTILNPLYPL